MIQVDDGRVSIAPDIEVFEIRSGLVWGQMVKAVVIRTPWQHL